MALRLQKRKWRKKDGTETTAWRLIIEDFSGGARVSRYPDKNEYAHYGLNPNDSYEDALEKLKVVRAGAELKRRAELRARIGERIKDEKQKESAFLPKDLYRRFEQWLIRRRAWDQIPSKVESHLLCMRRLILEVDIDPSEWPDQPGVIFNWFVKKGLSVSYFSKILPLINEYGYFYCREFSKPWITIHQPSDRIIEKMNDKNFDMNDGKTKESRPLKPEHLKQLSTFTPEKRRWVEYSLYFGLRPDEVDGLAPSFRDKRWKIEYDKFKTPILVVYQKKLVRIPRDRRWKRIPCILPSQKRLIHEIDRGELIVRPYARYLQRAIGPGYTLYAGRKGFEPMMRTVRQSAFNIRRWKGSTDFRDLDDAMRTDENSTDDGTSPKSISRALGHASLNRTQQNYTDPKGVDYDPV